MYRACFTVGGYAHTALQDDPEFGKYCHSADRILPEYQHLAVGDALLYGPTCDPQHGAWIVRPWSQVARSYCRPRADNVVA